jgi:phage-related protein
MGIVGLWELDLEQKQVGARLQNESSGAGKAGRVVWQGLALGMAVL